MKNTFDIMFVGLKQGNHVFDYNLENTFFKENNLTEIKSGSINVRLHLNKKDCH